MSCMTGTFLDPIFIFGGVMAEPLADQVMRKIGEAHELYHRLILMVGPAGSGKTKALQEVSTSNSVPLINVNLGLSRRMLDLAERQASANPSHRAGTRCLPLAPQPHRLSFPSQETAEGGQAPT